MRNLLPDGQEAAPALENAYLETVLLKDEFLPSLEGLFPPRDFKTLLSDPDKAIDTFTKEKERYTNISEILHEVQTHFKNYVERGYPIEHDNPFHTAGRIPGHDLRSIFNAPIGYLNLITDDLKDREDIPEETIESTTLVTNQLLPYLNSIAHLVTDGDKKCDYQMTPGEVTAFINNIDKEYKVELDNQLTGKMNSIYLIPVAQMIKNAAEYANDKSPNIQIREGPWRVIKVSDQGDGFDLAIDDIPSIFEDYTTRGTGLGLNLAKTLVHTLGGHIEVYSTDKDGTPFIYNTHWDRAQPAEGINIDKGTTFTINLF